jgi:hypothetical protein
LLLNLHQNLIGFFKITSNEFKTFVCQNIIYIKKFIYLKIDIFYFSEFWHNLSNQNFKNLILIRFKGIEANYLYVYKKIHNDMKPHDTKRQVTTQKN